MATVERGVPICPVDGSPALSILVTTPHPELTLPSSAYWGGRPASAAVTMKNWLLDRPDGSTAAFAIATVPLRYCVPGGGGSVTE
jgi:hypothetical protein